MRFESHFKSYFGNVNGVSQSRCHRPSHWQMPPAAGSRCRGRLQQSASGKHAKYEFLHILPFLLHIFAYFYCILLHVTVERPESIFLHMYAYFFAYFAY